MPPFDRFGPTQGDIHITSPNSAVLTVPANGVSHYHAKSVTVDAGATLTLIQSVLPALQPQSYNAAILYVDGEVSISGTLQTSYVASVPGSPNPVNWDGATVGTNGSAIKNGTGGSATAGVPTLHQIIYDGRYNATATDYRYYHLFNNWYNAGGGGKGWDTLLGSASVPGGFGGGTMVVIARGKISVASGGVISCKGQNGTNGAINVLGGAWAGGGGGGGGIILLISYTNIAAPAGALITCNGGNGGNGAVFGSGPTGGRTATGGGGGGGGFIFCISPHLNIGLNVTQVFPGTAGTTALGAGARDAFGGGGGGSFGPGGNGAANGTAGRQSSFPTSSGSSARGASQWIGV